MLRFPCHQQDGVHNSGLQHNLYNDGQLDGGWGLYGIKGAKKGDFPWPPNLIYPPHHAFWPALIE